MRRILIAFAASLGLVSAASAQTPTSLLNVSYDISRELYADINVAFIKQWKAKTGQDITINQSHNGSSRQARSILEGLEADVVTFNQVTDVQVLYDKGKLIPADWQKRLPNNSSPYYSLPAFLVRAGNPKHIKDWDDLVKPGVQVIFPNPKTSGNARYTYLAAYAYAKSKYGSDEKADDFVKKLFANVPVLDTGGRAATTTFVERQTGDVLITFEAETNGIRDLAGKDKYEVVVPSQSLLAEFPVSVVDKYADKHGTRALATAYLEFLYSQEGQTILAKQYNRVNDKTVAAQFKDRFPDVKLITVEDAFGGWDKVNADHLNSGAKLDQLFAARQN
ncbi:thiosulfate ABC transporter substrate-binding protein CysP [Bradyrhizobium sp. U87765 SZCCT0131]|uniref:thiosulfate ABC transporter substrate-binding protein CysP n=1 Tax=unclassified Bradyrhizobium TaxID=2631580 RepID=UPI001BAC7221|nr:MULTISPECIES: thiosulfate ABC transporter substrate-binding protein CysP [unclassified Bradyrhizobium]MBR1222063.1 thiosulfate ABC transporter substrate-binding protein CysP [Bradyrhizobium sp. U87765 SZCCT0131]MBR1263739.1 thiosulfate ABC transporter substrate-binding protein CysP [Bradyrhizobium sp. U87765 SZCCT0134]MBR1302691.1 thiosulfate ABC transporter substrate-binding protein CysP [Bradyrhizobium sp. U87765 SZCCT0110]MBR1319989.1 thiosulfate ABC transporter substrate-binding protein 